MAASRPSYGWLQTFLWLAPDLPMAASRPSYGLQTFLGLAPDQTSNGTVHMAKFKLEPIEGSSDKANKIKIMVKNEGNIIISIIMNNHDLSLIHTQEVGKLSFLYN